MTGAFDVDEENENAIVKRLWTSVLREMCVTNTFQHRLVHMECLRDIME